MISPKFSTPGLERQVLQPWFDTLLTTPSLSKGWNLDVPVPTAVSLVALAWRPCRAANKRGRGNHE